MPKFSSGCLDKQILQVAALRLGFHSRYYGSDFLRGCLATLVSHIRPNAYIGLTALIEQIDRSCMEFAADSQAQRNRNSIRLNQGLWSPSDEDIRALSSMADQAISPGNPLENFYLLGALLGDCELCCAHDSLGKNDLARLLVGIAKLPEIWLQELRVVRHLRDVIGNGELTLAALEAASAKANAEPLTVSAHGSVIVSFLDALVGSIAGCPAGLVDVSQEGRDAWIYERWRAEIPAKQILSELRSMPEWNSLENMTAVKAAAKRHANKASLPPPRDRKRGRPRKI